MGLLQYENKLSVLNFAIQRHQNQDTEDLVVKSKERLVFVTPLRRFAAGMH